MKNKGLTLVELLAVVVIMGLIIGIAVPTIKSTIEKSRLQIFKKSAELLAKSADELYDFESLDDEFDGSNITCADIAKIDTSEYDTCTITFDENNKAVVELSGKIGGKFENMVCKGTTSEMLCRSVSKEYHNAVQYITSLCKNGCLRTEDGEGNYLDGTPNDGLMQDKYGNIRYSGPGNLGTEANAVKNWAWFNNEYWRIIGVFEVSNGKRVERRVKMIRDASLGGYSWDTSAEAINSGYGINQWAPSWGTNGEYTGADLMRKLNTDYLNKGTGTVKWFNARSQEEAGGDYDLSKGISSDARLLVDDAIWYLGGGVNSLSLDDQYKRERGIEGYQLGSMNDGVTRTTEWIGKVGLIYPSDFAYASSNNACKENITTAANCSVNNWLHNNTYYWTLSPYSGYANVVQHVSNSGYVGSYSACYAYQVRPSVYLSSIVFLKGEGTRSNPYQIS